MDVKYRFALIGCGQISYRHAKQIARVGELTAVCDTDREKANRLAEEFGAQAFYDTDTLLKHSADFDVAESRDRNFLLSNRTASIPRFCL
jgi:predicted dehydrogenase